MQLNRIQIWLLLDLVPVVVGSRVPHGLSGPVQALSYRVGVLWWLCVDNDMVD